METVRPQARLAAEAHREPITIENYGKKENTMRSFATVVLSIARGLCLRDAFTSTSTTAFIVCFASAMLIAGCNPNGSTSGGGQESAQIITFAQLTSPVTYASGLTIALSATGGGSGNPVTFTVDATSTGKGTISGNTLTVTAAGKLVVDADQAGNSNYYAATQVSVTIVVSPATSTVSAWPTASAITVGQTLASSTLTGGTASVPGTFAWTTPNTIPAVGTDSGNVTFTPTDTTNYTTAVASVQLIVNPATPQITGFTPRYVVCDTQCNFVNYTVTGLGFENGDIVHDVSGLSPIDIPLVLSPGATSFGLTYQWQSPGSFQPWFETVEMQHPSGAYGNEWSTAFLGSASQSTLVVSATTGTLFQKEQQSGQVYWQKTDGTAGKWDPPYAQNQGSSSPSLLAADDVTGNVAELVTGATDVTPGIIVWDQAGFNGGGSYIPCEVTPTGMSFISSVAAKGGYMVFADPVENLVGIAKMDCTGYTTVSVAGQPWSVAMTNGTELDAHVLSRDKCANGIPCITKIAIPSGTIEGLVDLAGVTPVSTIRATTPYEGVYQVVASNLSSTAFVLFMSDSTDGKVLTINTNTSNGTKMSVTYTTPIADLPIGIALQESAASSTLWVGSIAADTGEAITHVGAIDPTTGNYTPAIGACQTGILAGGFIATSNGVYCAMGSTIAPPLVLQP